MEALDDRREMLILDILSERPSGFFSHGNPQRQARNVSLRYHVGASLWVLFPWKPSTTDKEDYIDGLFIVEAVMMMYHMIFLIDVAQ